MAAIVEVQQYNYFNQIIDTFKIRLRKKHRKKTIYLYMTYEKQNHKRNVNVIADNPGVDVWIAL